MSAPAHQRLSILATAAAAAVFLLLTLSSTAYAQAPGAVQTPLELRFDIARYRVEGNTLLAAEEVERIVSAFAGKDRKSTRLNSSHIQKSRMPSSA